MVVQTQMSIHSIKRCSNPLKFKTLSNCTIKFQVSYAKNRFFQRKIRIHIDTYGYTISWAIDFQWILLFLSRQCLWIEKLISGMILFLKVFALGLLMLSYYDLACEYNFKSEKLTKAYSQTTLWWTDKIGQCAKCMIELSWV